MPTEVEISNVGPIRHLRFDLPEDGGVVVLEGPNGAGKTTTISTLAGEYDGLTPRDGVIAGTARVGALELTVGQKVTARGVLEVRRLVAGADPSVLVDPGYKDPEANDLRRVLALCALAGIEPRLELFEQELGKPAGVSLRALVPDALDYKGVPDLAKALKAALEKASRNREGEAGSLRARASGLAAAMEGVSDGEPHNADALALATEDAVRAKAELDGRRRSAADALQLQASARAQVEKVDAAGESAERLEISLQETEKEAETYAVDVGPREIGLLDQAVKEAKEVAFKKRQRFDELKLDLASAQAELEVATVQRRRCEERLEQFRLEVDANKLEQQRRTHDLRQQLDRARAQEASVAELRKIVDRELPAFPDQAELAAAELRLSTARKAQERGAVVREARARQATALELLRQADGEQGAADALRAASQAVWQVVENAVERVRPRGLRLVGGRVVFQHPERKEVYFSELSNGERWRVALDAAIDAVGEGGLVGIRQEAWEGLDPENRAAIAAHCRERRAVVVTAQAAAGELRATVVR